MGSCFSKTKSTTQKKNVGETQKNLEKDINEMKSYFTERINGILSRIDDEMKKYEEESQQLNKIQDNQNRVPSKNLSTTLPLLDYQEQTR